MTDLNLSDRHIVESTAAKALAAGPDAVARAVKIHNDHLIYRRAEQIRLLNELASVQRAIAMREAALEALGGQPS